MAKTRTSESDINEIYCAYLLNGKKWDNLNVEKQIYDQRIGKLDDKTIDLKQRQAKSMAIAIVRWAHSNGYSGTIKNVYWTARSNFSFTSINSNWEEKSKDHPADILVEYSTSNFTSSANGNFLGISLKAIQRTSGDAPVKNPGTKKLSKFISPNNTEDIFSSIVKDYTDKASIQARIPKVRSLLDKNLTKKIWENPELEIDKTSKEILEKLKNECLSSCRNTLLDKLNSKDDDEVKLYILMDLLDTDKIPKYIKVTSRGTNTISSSVEVPAGQNNKKFINLMNKNQRLSYEKAESEKGHSLTIKCGSLKIIGIRFKFSSTPFATSLKMSISPMSGSNGEVEKD